MIVTHSKWSSGLLVVIAALSCTWTAASQVPDNSPFPRGIHLELIERVSSSESAEYREVLSEIDQHLQAYPDDHVAAVERCRFVTNYAYQEEVTIDSASGDSDACIAALSDQSYTAIPVVRIFLLEQEWGEETIAEAEQLLADASKWSPADRAAVHARLSSLYSMTDQNRSGQHALKAVELDPTTGIQLSAAEYLIRIGAKRKAIDAIHALPDQQWNSWTLQQAVQTLLLAGEPQAAFRLVTQKSEIELNRSSRIALVRALFDVNDRASAEVLLRAADVSQLGGNDGAFADRSTLQELFELRRDYGTEAEALVAYGELRDRGWRADPFGWYRLSLVKSAAAAPWKPRDLLGPGALALLLVLVALVPAIVIVPIHYRSVSKRLRGFVIADSTSLAPWDLRHAWYALAAVLVISTITAYLFAYPYFENMMAPFVSDFSYETAAIDDMALGKSMLWGAMLSLIAFAPLVRHAAPGPLLTTRWSVSRSVLGAIGVALGFLFLAGLLRGLMAWSGLAIGIASDTVRGMRGIEQAYGALAMIGFAAVLTPVMEEFLFRGVLLRASARHLAVWAAVCIQAVVFALWHEDPADYPVLLALALAAAWLAIRSGGLLAPITFHATINLLAVAQVLHVGRLMNQGG